MRMMARAAPPIPNRRTNACGLKGKSVIFRDYFGRVLMLQYFRVEPERLFYEQREHDRSVTALGFFGGCGADDGLSGDLLSGVEHVSFNQSGGDGVFCFRLFYTTDC